jgi:hypothetical protein
MKGALGTANFRFVWSIWLLICVLLVGFVICSWMQMLDENSTKELFGKYVEDPQFVPEAIAVAHADKRFLMLEFGSASCDACVQLQYFLHENEKIRRTLLAKYVEILIDAHSRRIAEIDVQYGTPTRLGLPAIVICDSSGRLLQTLGSSDISNNGRYDAGKILSILSDPTNGK